MRRLFKIICFVLIGSLLISCGGTRIFTDQYLDADIYVNGVNKGKKDVKITRVGPPRKVFVEAKYNGKTIGQATVKRRFAFSTFVIGYFTYGAGFLFAWRYPEVIVIETHGYDVRDNNTSKSKSTWDDPSGSSVWDNP